MKQKLPAVFSFLFLIFPVAIVVFLTTKEAYSVASHIVISEVQTAGGTATDEFIELYNPTNNSVTIDGWRLTRKTSGGTQANLVASMSGTIPARGYYLVASPDYDGLINPDTEYSATSSAIASNNTILLYSDAGTTIIDKVGMGTAGEVEASTAANPATNGSIERKALSSSTTQSMGPGGADETKGNGEDTDNNSNDFVARAASNPQNSLSSTETPPTDSVSEPISGPTSPTPTATPVSAPVTPSPTPSVTPSSTPSSTPSATPSITPSPTPSATPTVTPTPRPVFELFNIQCRVEYRTFRFFFMIIKIPSISCFVV